MTTDMAVAALRRELRETQSTTAALDASDADVDRALRRAAATRSSTAVTRDAMELVRRRRRRLNAHRGDNAANGDDDDDDDDDDEDEDEGEDARATYERAWSDVGTWTKVETCDAVARGCRAELSRDDAHMNVGLSVARRVRAAVSMARATQTSEPYALFFEAYARRASAGSSMERVVDAFDGIRRAKRDSAILIAAAPRVDGPRIAAALMEFYESTLRALEDACAGDVAALECIRQSYDKFCG